MTAYMAVYGFIWQYMAVCGHIWQYMGVFDCVWLHMAIYDCIHGCIWLHIAVYGSIWQYMAVACVYSHILPYVDIQQPSTAIWSRTQLYVAIHSHIYSHILPYVAIHNQIQPYTAICGHITAICCHTQPYTAT